MNNNDVVVHRVYNNCGCYDSETYQIVVLAGDRLELDCYGTACENATVTYHATSPTTCGQYRWYVDGGTIVEEGTYDELIARDGYFAELVERQRRHRRRRRQRRLFRRL